MHHDRALLILIAVAAAGFLILQALLPDGSLTLLPGQILRHNRGPNAGPIDPAVRDRATAHLLLRGARDWLVLTPAEKTSLADMALGRSSFPAGFQSAAGVVACLDREAGRAGTGTTGGGEATIAALLPLCAW